MQRFIDYFLVIGVDEEKQKTGVIDGKIVCKLPLQDWDESPLVNENLALFCQPLGWKLSPRPQEPTFFVSVLTDIKADRHYCACLTFWESYSSPADNRRCDDDDPDCDSVVLFQNQSELYAPKCLVLVSRFHYVHILRNCLSIIYSVYVDQLDVPLEIVLGNLLSSVEVPGPGEQEVEFSLGAGDCQYLQCSPNPSVPHTGQIVYDLFEQLGIHAVITLFIAVMSEHKVLIHSHSFSRLHDACEALISLMYPFRYSHVYIPLLPSSLIEVLSIPTPFLIGCHSDLRHDFEDLLLETIVVDLDCGWLLMPTEIQLPKLDAHSYSQLVAQLCLVIKPHSVHADRAFTSPPSSPSTASPPHLLDKEIRAIFLRFLAQTLLGYRNFLQVVRIFPSPYITFHKALFLGTRNLVGNEFVVRLLDSMFFSTFIFERGPPYRHLDLFDHLYASIDQTLSAEVKNSTLFLSNIRKLAEQLLLNEFSSNTRNPKVKIPKPSAEGIQRTRQCQFPSLNCKQIQEKVENEIIKREMTESLLQRFSREKQLVPFGISIDQLPGLGEGDQAQLITNSARRLEVLKSCVNSIFENRVLDARKTFPAVLRALKSKFARLALAQELSSHVNANGGNAVLEREQFDLIVKLMNCALQQDSDHLRSSCVQGTELGDVYGLAAAILPLSMSFCRRLTTGVFQFAYSCLQEHEVWSRISFWESCFYEDVQKDLIALYRQTRDKPSAMDSLAVAGEQLQQANTLQQDELSQRLNNENSTVYSQLIHYASRMVYLRLPMDVAEKERSTTTNANSNHTSFGMGEDGMLESSRDLDNDSTQEESGRSLNVNQSNGELSGNVIRFVQRFIDKITLECGVAEEQLQSLQVLVPSIVALHADTLDGVCKESRKLPPITKAKITLPPLLAGEELALHGLRAFLLPDGREELMGNSYQESGQLTAAGMNGCVSGPVFLPAEGALFLTNYRIIFRGRPWDPLASDCCVIRSFPIITLTREKRIHLPSQLISSLDQCLHEGLQLRSNCFQVIRVAFDQEVNSDSIELLRKLISKARAPANVFHLFTFTSQMAASAQLRLLSLQKQKEKNGTLRGFAKKTLLKTAERTGLHMPKSKRKNKDRSLSTFISEVSESGQAGSGGDGSEDTSSLPSLPPPIPPPPVSSNVEGLTHKEKDARTLRKLLELPYVKDYQRLGLANLRSLMQLSSSSHLQGQAKPGLLHALVGGGSGANLGVHGASNNRDLRISIVNIHYTLSPTYPAFVVLPFAVSDESVKKLSKCYKMQRFPAVVWRHPQHRTLLLRAGQLHGKGVMGLLKAHTSTNVPGNLATHPPPQDSSTFEQEKLFKAIINLTPTQGTISNSSYSAASINSLEQSSVCDQPSKEQLKPTKSASSSSMSASFQRAINTLRTSGGKSGLGTIGHSMGKQLQKLNQKMMDSSDAHSVCSNITNMSVQSTRMNGSAGIPTPVLSGSAIVAEASRSTANASLCIFGEKQVLKSLRADQLPIGCSVHSLELHEVKHVKASFKKLLRVCSPSTIARSDADQGFLQQLQGSEWMRQLQSLMSASNELVHCLHQRRCSALLCLEDGMDLVPQIVSIAQLCLDPHYRTFAGFRVLIEKEWLAFGHRFSYRCNQTAASMASGFAPIFLQFLDLVHQLLHQFPLAFEFNQYFLKFLAYHHVSGRFRTFLLDNECERAEYGWLYEDLKRPDEEFEFGREMKADQSNMTTNNGIGPVGMMGNASAGSSATYHYGSSNGPRQSRASSIAGSGINYIGTSFWDYCEAMWSKSAIFYNFSYIPNLMLANEPPVVLRPSCSLISLRLWDYYTSEEISHGPSYDLEMVVAEKQRREEVEATSQASTVATKSSQRRIVVNPIYDSVSHFQPSGIEEMLEQIRHLQLELGQPVQGWSETWDKLEIPMLSTAFAKQNEVDRQISVSSQILRRYNLAAFSQLASTRNAMTTGLPIKLHQFEKFNYSTPVSCDYCKKLLWDLVKNGMKCSDCGYNSHEKCYEFVAKNKCEPKELKRLIENSLSNPAGGVARTRSSLGESSLKSMDTQRRHTGNEETLGESGDDDLDDDLDENTIGDNDEGDDEEEDDDEEEEEEDVEYSTSEHSSAAQITTTSINSRNHLLTRANSNYYRPFLNSSGGSVESQTHAGYLCKKGALLKGWKQSWFVLDSNKHQLRYYENKESSYCKGFIDLAEVVSVVLLHNEANSFEVKTIRRNYSFMAIDNHAAQEWVERLQACLQ